MQKNISTIYRFNTPFLNIEKEKDSLVNIKEKIKDYVQKFEWVGHSESRADLWDYIKIRLIFDDDFGCIDFYYIKEFNDIYYMPIFKMDIFLSGKILHNKKIAIWFLNNIYECFDWLTEKEYLIDTTDNNFCIEWFFRKVRPVHQFSDLNIIQKHFELKDWVRLFKEFLNKFPNKDFAINLANSWDYHRIHSILLYYIYLVYIMFKNIADSTKQLEKLEILDFWENEAQKELARQRLGHVNSISMVNFKDYYQKLEAFFGLFK